ncbi:MAG: hypothetical protein LBV12_01020 [Puniceicoccales bacterium]|nr:hypothetical protein [Puniceicoccales bacterium]
MKIHLPKKENQLRPLIAVIGDAKVEKGSRKDLLAEAVGRELINCGYRVLTGGMGGVMESTCRGAKLSNKYQPGDTVGILPGHDASEANQFVDISIPTGLDNVRNSVVAHANAIIAIGGGAGTMSEICLAWIYKRLIIGLRIEGWSLRMADTPVDNRIRYRDINDDRVYGANSAEEAVFWLKELLPLYQRQHRAIQGKSASAT